MPKNLCLMLTRRDGMNSVIYAVSGHLAKQLCCCGREHELEPASGTKTVPIESSREASDFSCRRSSRSRSGVEPFASRDALSG